MTVISLAGIVFQSSLYASDELRQSFVANDILNLVIGLPFILGSVWSARRGKWTGLLFLPGALFYIVYNYIAYSIATLQTWLVLPCPHPLFSPEQPFVILPDARAYARPEANRLLFGFRERESASVHPFDLPDTMNGFTFRQDSQGWQTLMEGAPNMSLYFPLIEQIQISSYVRGLSNYTPDGNFVLGEYPGLSGFIAATGCAGGGIAMSGASPASFLT